MIRKKLLISLVFLLSGCGLTDKPDLEDISIIPQPVSVERQYGAFELTPETVIQLPRDSEKAGFAGTFLKEKLAKSTGFYNISTTSSPAKADSNRIILSLAPDTSGFGNSEGYRLNVSPEKVEINAPTSHGLFNGVQSLLQLFPTQIFQKDYTLVPQNVKWTAPAVSIKDYPRFSYRSMHLDVGRQFFDVDFVKQYIDMLAMHKMNRFHWHLTEDQGWRIEIKQYPKLTEVGAWRDSTILGPNNSGRYRAKRTGGFYTQEQIREVVEYAQKRHITIVPEIEMPGHSSAAVAAYPELGCVEGKDYRVKTDWGIFEDIYCPSEKTFTFLENVLTEVMELFPGEYIHVGGDEAPKEQWENSEVAQKVIEREGLENEDELQSYFISRIENFLNENGRSMIGWNEILEGGLAPNATVQSWQGVEPGIKAAQQHHNVVMSPNVYYYVNFYQATKKTEPIAQPQKINSLEEVYMFDPIPDVLTAKEAKFIKGVEACLWSEFLGSTKKAEYMAYPRAFAVAETGWTPKGQRSWDDFWKRLQPHFERLDALGINYGPHYKGQKPEFK